MNETLEYNKNAFIKSEDIESMFRSFAQKVQNSGGGAIDEELFKNLVLNIVYPVGSVYLSYENASPASFLGGTWEQITGYFLRAANDINTGGNDEIALTIAQMPSHSHNIYVSLNSSGTATLIQFRQSCTNQGTIWGGAQATGNNEPHSNMPVYQNLYCWKRTE